jgi:formylglycine-generating enzyme required for sulfatase activity
MTNIEPDASNPDSISSIDMTFFPEPFEWVQITKGDVVVPHPFYNLSEMVRTSLADFYIAKYPITNEQYEYYLRKTQQKTRSSIIERSIEFRSGRNPVVDMYYFEAVAFCRWLSHQVGWTITLPSDSQWIRAARGTETQQYPWGDTWDGTQCNTEELGLGHTTPVDHYPKGASPFGIMDMLGNVNEWCCTDPATGQHHVDDNPKDLDPFQSTKEVHRVFMGGSFDSPIREASLNRYGGATSTGYPYVTGIRPVLNLIE